MQEAKEMDNAERLAVVETELKQLNKMTTSINDKLDVWNQSYVPRNEINMMFDSRDREIANIKHVQTVEDNNKWSLRKLWPAWLGVALGVAGFIDKLF